MRERRQFGTSERYSCEAATEVAGTYDLSGRYLPLEWQILRTGVAG